MKRSHAVAGVAVGILGVAFGFAFAGRESPQDASTLSPRPALETGAESGGAMDPTAQAVSAALGSGETLAVSRESLASGRPLVVRLQLAQPEDPGEPLAGRIMTEGRYRDLAATVQGDAEDVAQVEIEAAWLTPGRYVIEIRTSERSHFPLRRYALDVH